MKEYEIKWKSKNKYKPFERTNIVRANTVEDALRAFKAAFGSQVIVLNSRELITSAAVETEGED